MKKKTLLYFIPVLLFVLIAFVPSVKTYLKDAFFPVAAIESAVKISDQDYDVELKGINVPDANLKNFKGKTLFLNFWGTWCPPCVKEWPSVQELYETRKGKIDFVLIAMQDDEEKVRNFIKENNYTAPVYIAASPISENILPKVFPTTFLVAPSGQILKKVDYSENWMSRDNQRFIDNVTQ